MKTVIKAGLIGRPVSKSLSPAIFKVFAGLTGAEINYELRECGPGELAAVIACSRGEGWAGFNVTIPYKRDVAAMLALRDAPCRDTGAVNTVRFDRAGLVGLNTDAAAIRTTFVENGFNVKGRSAAVFGSGGSAAAAGWALGRSQAAAVEFRARDAAAGAALAAKLTLAFPGTAYRAAPFSGVAADIYVNATPLGMYEPGMPPCEPGCGSACLDLAYRPGGTELVKAAAAAGAMALDGFEVLVRQASLALHCWSGLPGGDIVKFNSEALKLFRAGLQGGA